MELFREKDLYMALEANMTKIYIKTKHPSNVYLTVIN